MTNIGIAHEKTLILRVETILIVTNTSVSKRYYYIDKYSIITSTNKKQIGGIIMNGFLVAFLGVFVPICVLVIILCLVFLFRYRRWLNTPVNNTKKKTWNQVGTYLLLGADQVDYTDRSKLTESYAPQINKQQNEMFRQQMYNHQNEMLMQQMTQQQNEILRQQTQYNMNESVKESMPSKMGGYNMTYGNSFNNIYGGGEFGL